MIRATLTLDIGVDDEERAGELAWTVVEAAKKDPNFLVSDGMVLRVDPIED